MSVQDFTATIKSYAFRSFFKPLSTTNVLKSAVSDIRGIEQGADKTSFYISPEVIGQVIEKLTGQDATPESISNVISKLKDVRYGIGNKRKALVQGKPNLENNSLYFPKISFDSINTVLEKGFSDILEEARKKDPKVKISDYFDRGHVFGILTNKVSELLGSVSRSTALEEQGKTLLVGILQDLYNVLQEEDIKTSNLKSLEYKLYAKYSKNKNKYLVELQLKDVNQSAGRQVAEVSKALRKYFNPDLTVGKFTSGAGAQLIQKLISSKGSPSMLDLIQQSLVGILSGRNASQNQYSIDYTKVLDYKVAIDNTAIKKLLNDEKRKLQKAISNLKKRAEAGNLTKISKSTVSLSSLQVLLDKSLAEQIQKNMGTGNSKTVLNYRSGRFANSAEIKNITLSREGMLSVYYTYMKYPYATFSEGGAQGQPASRDPKLLISKSIREIGAAIVKNRMRAVLV